MNDERLSVVEEEEEIELREEDMAGTKQLR